MEWLGALTAYRDWVELPGGRLHGLAQGRHQDGRSVIAKWVVPGRGDPTLVALLVHEARILEQLADVPGVVRLVELARCEGHPVLILEEAGARNLAELVAERPLDPARFLAIARPLTETVAALHRRGLLHRDLSLANVVLDEQDRPTLLDFELTAAQRLLHDVGSGWVGTLAYVAPELTGRTTAGVDQRADLYSLGVCFYRLLSGELPFVGDTPRALIHAHLALRPAPLRHIPQSLWQVLARLLSKAPERRYQSAPGLLADLEELARRAARDELEAPFEAGRHDRPSPHRVPQRLHGRSAALAELASALGRIDQGGLLLVSGGPGVGKSSLVARLQPLIEARGGWYAEGKCEQFADRLPFSGLGRALTGHIGRLLSLPPETAATWGARIAAALGPDAGLLTDLVPDLGLLLGPRPAPPELEPGPARVRFERCVEQLLSTLAQTPLVLFLDDIQWADPATLRLVLRVADAPPPGLLLVAAWRSNEVVPGEALDHTLQQLRSRGRPSELLLTPLAPVHSRALAADVLGADTAEIEELGAALHQRTAGNPFFLVQLLRRLLTDELLERGPAGWRLTGPLPALGTDVAEFMVQLLSRLPRATQELLGEAALHGTVFDACALAHPGARQALLDDLEAAVLQGLLAPCDDTFRIRAGLSEEALHTHGVRLRFPHDRIQAAARGLLSTERLRALHLELGRRRWAELRAGADTLFELLGHFAEVPEVIDDPEELEELSELARLAGERAARATSWQTAARFAWLGLGWCPATAHARHHALRLARARYTYLAGDPEEADRQLGTLLTVTEAPQAAAEVCQLRIVVCSVAGRFQDALRWLRVGLAGLDDPLPEDEPPVAEELNALVDLLEERPPEWLLTAAPLSDPRERARLGLLASAGPAAWFVAPALASLIVIRLSAISLAVGPGPGTPYGFTYLGMLLGAMRARYALGHRVARIGVSVAERFGDPRQRCIALQTMGTITHHWHGPLRASPALLDRAIEAGLEAGALQYTAYACASRILCLHVLGEPLHQLAEDIERGLDLTRRQGHAAMTDTVRMYRQTVRSLRGLTGQLGLAGADFDRERFFRESEATPICLGAICEIQLAVLDQDRPRALQAVARARATRPAIQGLVTMVSLSFWEGLARLQGDLQDEHSDASACLAELAHWAEHAPSNFRHRLLLLQGAAARREAPFRALTLFRDGIEVARAEGFTQDAALGHLMAARLLRRQGLGHAALGHQQAALGGFRYWGANAVVERLLDAWPELPRGFAAEHSSESWGSDATRFDLGAVISASAALSRPAPMNEVLGQLLRLTVELAGAQEAALVVSTPEGLSIRARLDADGAVSEPRQPLHRSQLPAGLIQLVHRQGRARVVDDALAAPAGPDEALIRSRQLRSLLVVPLRERGALLYAENNLAPRVFHGDRFSALEALTGHMAIALANADLFGDLRREVELRSQAEAGLRQANLQLEGRVARRTAALEEANRALSRANTRLDRFASMASHDLQEPLRAVRGFLDLLDQRIGADLGERERSYLDYALAGGAQMSQLITDLLDLTRLARSSVTHAPVPLEEVLQEARQALAMRIEESQATLVAAPLPTVYGHRGQLLRLFQNALGNALKFHRPGVPPRIHIGAEPREGRLHLAIADNGIGLDAQQAAGAFEPFRRLHGRSYAGTGIGLAICRTVVELHGGRIGIEGEPGVGATLRFSLPLDAPDEP